MSLPPHRPRTAALLLALICCGCGPNPGSSVANPSSLGNDPAPAASQRPQIWTTFEGARALAHAQAQVDCGPRPAGSPALETARGLIIDSLKSFGWKAERQEFEQDTPHGKIRMTNIVATFTAAHSSPAASPPPNRSRALVCSHYDTKKFSTISFLGANDGASSTGALLELARVLAQDTPLAAKVDLVFFDGEEAMVQFTESDGLYGSRHFASALRASGRAPQYAFGIVLDMIGDRNLTITLPFDSPKELTRGLLESARTLGVRDKFSLLDRSLLDDHVPLNEIARIPTVDVIDFDYNAWHTADDTMAQLSAQSLETIGSVTLHYLSNALAAQPPAK